MSIRFPVRAVVSAALLAGLASVLSLAGCNKRSAPVTAGGTPPPSGAQAPSGTPAAPAAPVEDSPKVARFAGFTGPKPATWQPYPPESTMRAANYVVPAASGEEQAHLVVFHGIGGGVDANIIRWQGQFQSSDGGPVTAQRSTMEVAGFPVTIAELSGAYLGMGMPSHKPDQLFIAAIVETPMGDLQIRLVGSTATVEANREAFMTLIRGLQPDQTGYARPGAYPRPGP